MALCAARAAEHSIQPRPHTWWESSKADVAMVRASPLSASKLGLERVSICGTATSTAAGKENSTQEVATRSPTGEAAGRARSLFEPTPSKGEGEKLRHPARHCLQKLPGLQRSQSLLQRIVRTNARIYALRDEPSKTYVTLKQSAANETGTSSYRHSKLGRRRIQGRLHGRGPHYRPEGTGNDKMGRSQTVRCLTRDHANAARRTVERRVGSNREQRRGEERKDPLRPEQGIRATKWLASRPHATSGRLQPRP